MCSLAGVQATPWMASLPDAMLIRRVSLPGAHDAAAKGLAFAGTCQSKTIEGLWDAGVRAFDFRPGGSLMIYHGSSSTGVTMAQAFSVLESKLAADPSDFAFVMVKNEDGSSSWATNMSAFLKEHDAYIATFRPDMTLAQARGKIVVVTRDAIADYPKAGYVGNWGDNQDWKEGYMEGNGLRETMRLQDNYQYGNDTNSKANAVRAMLAYSAGFNDEPMWAVNFTSGYTGSMGTNSNITSNAKAANKAAYDYIVDPRNPQGRTGVVFMDFAGDDSCSGQLLVDAIIARNSNPIQIGTLARTKGNWTSGSASKGVGTTNYTDKSNSVVVIESYRDDSYTTGEVLKFHTAGVPNGEYVVSLHAHAHWTPGRGNIRTAACADGELGVAQLVVNDNVVSLPVAHNSGFVKGLEMYAVPATVTDGTLTIKLESVKNGANWFTVYVDGIYRLSPNETVYNKNFNGEYFGWASNTDAANQCVKWGGGDSPFATASYENWRGTAYTGKLCNKQTVLNGKYRVELDIKVNNTDGQNVYFYANNSKVPVTNTNVNSYSTEIDVTNRTIEFGLGMDAAVANWVLIDNPRITLLECEDYNVLPLTAVNESHEVDEIDGTFAPFNVSKPIVDAGYDKDIVYSVADASGNAVNTAINEVDGKMNFSITTPGAYTFKAKSFATVAHNESEVSVPVAVYADPGLSFPDEVSNASVEGGSVTFNVAPASFAKTACNNEISYVVMNDAGEEVPAEITSEGSKVKVTVSSQGASTFILKASSPRENFFKPSFATMRLESTQSAIVEIAGNTSDEQWFDLLGNRVEAENLRSGLYIRVSGGKAEKVVH